MKLFKNINKNYNNTSTKNSISEDKITLTIVFKTRVRTKTITYKIKKVFIDIVLTDDQPHPAFFILLIILLQL